MATAGPSTPPLPVNSLPLPTSYSPSQLEKVLILADTYMDPREYYLFKLGCDVEAANFFKQSILPRLDVFSDPLGLEQVFSNQLMSKSFNRPAVMNHVWSHLIKTTMKNCSLLRADVTVASSWQIMMRELKRIHAEYQPIKESIAQQKRADTEKINKYDYSQLSTIATQKCFLDFMGQLLKTGSVQTVMLIHQFFYIVNKVAKEEHSQMDRYWLGTFVAPSIHFALFRNLHPKEEVDNITHDECAFFAKICEFMLMHPIFDKPFNPEDYQTFSQDLESFSELRRSLLCTLSQPDEFFLPTSVSLLRTLYPTHLFTFAGSEISREQSLENSLSKMTISGGVVMNPLIPLLGSKPNAKNLKPSDIYSMHQAKEKRKRERNRFAPSLAAEPSSSLSAISTTTSSSVPAPLVAPRPYHVPTDVIAAADDVQAELRMRLHLPAFDKARNINSRQAPGSSDFTPRPSKAREAIKPKGL